MRAIWRVFHVIARDSETTESTAQVKRTRAPNFVCPLTLFAQNKVDAELNSTKQYVSKPQELLRNHDQFRESMKKSIPILNVI